MTGAQWTRITALFDELRERSADERRAWLDAAHGDDAETCVEVAAMLRAYDADPGFLEQGDDLAGAVGDVTASGLVGRRLGPWRLVAEIGRGGMGVVFEARRDDQEFDRRAAIKVLPAWSASPLVERFRFERRVLASLDHPGIARLLDAGTTSDGQPYFVMELVDGRPIDAWCRERGLGVRDRVALVERVSDALAYAHRHLVVHRDVKPANILVTAEGVPKLLDFGIATLLTADGESTGGLTRTGHHSFTPEYASPEQVRGEPVTTASDVYSLGVVLFRLLAGVPPYSLKGLGALEAMQAVCEIEPPVMSAVAPAAVAGTLRGDLDRIVDKALRKAPRERYGTVADLAADLRAWQDGRPVSAAAQSVSYRVTRFVRRNRTRVAATAALVLALVGGAAATAWQARVAARERDKAQNRFRQVQQFSRALLFDVHAALRRVPGTTEPRRLLLERAVGFMDGLAADAADDRELQLELSEGYRRLGLVQGAAGVDNLGDTAGALASFQKAARLADAVHEADPGALRPLVAAFDAWSEVTDTAGDLIKEDLVARGRARCLSLIDDMERRQPRDVDVQVAIATSRATMGVFLSGHGDFAPARGQYLAALAVFEQLPADVRVAQVRPYSLTLKSLGGIELRADALDDSERHYRAALALEEDARRRDPGNQRWPFEMSYTLSDLGLIMAERKRDDLAVPLWTRALEIRRQSLAADPKNVRMMHALANISSRLGGLDLRAKRHDSAIGHFEEELRLREQIVAAQPDVQSRRFDRGWAVYYLANALAEASAGGRPADRANRRRARDLFALVTPEQVRVNGKPDEKFRTAYDTLAARLTR